MNDRTQKALEIITLLIGLAISTAAFAKAWFVLPYRVEQLEARAQQADQMAANTRELLLRIDERTAGMQRDLAELKARAK